METSTGPETSWADASETWAETVGDNMEPESAAPENAMQEQEATLFPATSGETAHNALNAEGYALDLPEGIEADSTLLREFGVIAKENGLPPEAARKILDLEVANVQRQVEAFTRQQSAWREEITGDPLFGGTRLASTVASARKALAAYDPEGSLLPELNRTGYGNHPGIVRFLARVGKTLREDTAYHHRNTPAPDTRPLRDRLWPD